MMEPGKGYKLHLASGTGGSFIYPPPAKSGPPAVATGSDPDVKTPELLESAPSWSVNYHAYQHNMTATAVLKIGDSESIDENDMVGAFVGNECRGAARPLYVDGVGRYEIFLMVCGNDAGELVSLRAFDANAGLVYDITKQLTFEPDKVAGSVHEPVVLTAGDVWTDEVLPAAFALGRNCPNPFNATTKIAYDVPAAGGHVTLRIYEVSGRLVRTLADRVETPGKKTAIWDGHSNQGQRVASGVYFFRMTAPGFEKTSRMVMMK